MKHLALKNFKYYERMSEETMAYSADIFLNGKNIGTASNRGNGGSDDFWLTDWSLRGVIESIYKKSFEEILEDLVMEKLKEMDDKRMTKEARAIIKKYNGTKLVYCIVDKTYGGYQFFSGTLSDVNRARVQHSINSEKEEVIFFN